MYKYAAGELKDLEIEGNKAFFKKATIPAEVKNVKQEVDPYDLISKADVDLQKLNEIFKSVMRKQVDKVDRYEANSKRSRGRRFPLRRRWRR